MRRITWFALLLVTAAAGCSRDSDDGVCHEAADLCGAAGDFSEDDCSGEQKTYAECIVDRGDCEPATLTECAQGGGGDGGGGGGGGGGGSIELTIESVSDLGDVYVDVSCTITNVGESEPVAVAPTYFQIEDDEQNLHIAGGGTCDGGELLAVGGSEGCDLQFTLSGAEPIALVYRDPAGREAEATFDGVCSAGLEDTAEACSDGCSNDADSFVDCDDYDCCDVVDCPSTSQCGQQQQCAEGPEDTPDACSDGCSNDTDSFIDCEDYDCCDVVACSPGTACGDQ